MPEIICHTNLDLDHREVWPRYLPVVPREGDLIESGHTYEGGFVLQLEVVRVTWKPVRPTTERTESSVWAPVVELHLPKHRFTTLRHFFEWYGKITGRGVGAFI